MISLQPSMEYILENLSINDTFRGDCPGCRRRGTFTATRMRNHVVWNCYSAGCKMKGKRNVGGLSTEDVRNTFSNSNIIKKGNYNGRVDIGSMGATSRVIDSLNKYNINFEDIPVRYDPKENRIVYLIEDDRGDYSDGIGRAINKYKLPKWKRYSGCDHPVIVPFNKRAGHNKLFVVEDIVSAWKIVKYVDVYDAMALLGTSLSDKQLQATWEYDHVVVCLDKDATGKAIDMTRRISIAVVSCKVSMLDKDIKDMNVEDIQKCWT